MECIPAGTVYQPADNNAVWSQSAGLLPRRRCWFMMQNQDASASDALVMCRLFWHLEMLTTRHVSAGVFLAVYFLAHAAKWRWLAHVTFSWYRGSTGSTPPSLQQISGVSAQFHPPTHCCWVRRMRIPTPSWWRLIRFDRSVPSVMKEVGVGRMWAVLPWSFRQSHHLQ